MRQTVHSPTPLPRYSSAANNTGDSSPTRILANGVLAPNNRAATRAATMAERPLMRLSISHAWPRAGGPVGPPGSATIRLRRGLEFCRERHEQLASEHVVNAVRIRGAVGNDERIDHRRILVEHIVCTGANLQDLVDIPSGFEIQVIKGRNLGVVIVVRAPEREMQSRIAAVIVLRN